MIHTREAEDDTFRILAEERRGDVGGVFHCFTGDRAWRGARSTSVSTFRSPGIVTFPRALELKEVARMVPLDRLLDRDRQPVSGAGAASRQAQRAGARGPRRRSDRRAARHYAPRRLAQRHDDNFVRLFNP